MTSFQLVCALVCLQAGVLQAQEVDAPARAKRDADNPLRMIIEASKLKPRQKSPEAEPAAKPVAQAVPARPPTGKPASSTGAPQAARAGAAGRTASLAFAAEAERPTAADIVRIEPLALPAWTDVLPLPAATPAQTTSPAPEESPLPNSGQALAEPSPTPPSTQTQEEAPKTGPGSDAEPATASHPAATAPWTPTPVATPAPPEVLQLADYVEPTLPDRVRRGLQGDGEVEVHFTVNPDGSVADASVRSSSDSVLDPIALDAVRQWRYRPITTARAHAVQLVFRLHE